MSVRVWIGLAITVAWAGSSIARVREARRSGATQDYGHPVADSLLLLISALVLAGALALVTSFVGTHRGESRYLGYGVLLLMGAGLTWACNGILRRSRRLKSQAKTDAD